MKREPDSPGLSDPCSASAELHSDGAQHRAAVGKLYADQGYRQRLTWSIRAITRSEAAAEDAVSEAFTIACERPPANAHCLKAYLHKIAHNLAIQEWRHRRRAETNAETASESSGEEDSDLTPEEDLTQRQDVAAAYRCLDRLPFRRQLIIRLNFWVTSSTEEIIERCKELGIEVTKRTVQRDLKCGLDDIRRENQVTDGLPKEQRT